MAKLQNYALLSGDLGGMCGMYKEGLQRCAYHQLNWPPTGYDTQNGYCHALLGVANAALEAEEHLLGTTTSTVPSSTVMSTTTATLPIPQIEFVSQSDFTLDIMSWDGATYYFVYGLLISFVAQFLSWLGRRILQKMHMQYRRYCNDGSDAREFSFVASSPTRRVPLDSRQTSLVPAIQEV